MTQDSSTISSRPSYQRRYPPVSSNMACWKWRIDTVGDVPSYKAPFSSGIFRQPCLMTTEGASHKIPLNHHFPMVFLRFPMVFPWFSHGFTISSTDLPAVGNLRSSPRNNPLVLVTDQKISMAQQDHKKTPNGTTWTQGNSQTLQSMG